MLFSAENHFKYHYAKHQSQFNSSMIDIVKQEIKTLITCRVNVSHLISWISYILNTYSVVNNRNLRSRHEVIKGMTYITKRETNWAGFQLRDFLLSTHSKATVSIALYTKISTTETWIDLDLRSIYILYMCLLLCPSITANGRLVLIS